MQKFKKFCAIVAFCALIITGALIVSALGRANSMAFVDEVPEAFKRLFGGVLSVRQIIAIALAAAGAIAFIVLLIVCLVKKKGILLPFAIVVFFAMGIASVWRLKGVMGLFDAKVYDCHSVLTSIHITKTHGTLAFFAWWTTLLFLLVYIIFGFATLKAPKKEEVAAPVATKEEPCECCQEEVLGDLVTITMGGHTYKARLIGEGECECHCHEEECCCHKEEAPVEEKPAEEPAPAVVEEPAPAPAPAVVEEPAPAPAPVVEEVPEGNAFPTIKTKSFATKFKESDKELRAKYSELKNALLSHKKIRGRVSTTCDSYRLGRKLLAKIVFAGKHIKLYLALDPKAYDASKYHQVDVSEKKKFEEVPMQLRIQSDLSVRKALALINELCTKNGSEVYAKYKAVDYSTKNGLEK
ncbi:MAG: hypothetical protein MJ228_02495 [Bacilli bacterium]|nr:hypothetical protein [Bacilli bacterium]